MAVCFDYRVATPLVQCTDHMVVGVVQFEGFLLWQLPYVGLTSPPITRLW
jgi:hypothetical protein